MGERLPLGRLKCGGGRLCSLVGSAEPTKTIKSARPSQLKHLVQRLRDLVARLRDLVGSAEPAKPFSRPTPRFGRLGRAD